MSKVWYCANCGYEVSSRGRCHACGQKLIASALAPLAPGQEEDEVGYRIDGWEDHDRGRLISLLNHRGVPHRFEDEELVVAAEDEELVDDLIAELATRFATEEADDELDEDPGVGAIQDRGGIDELDLLFGSGGALVASEKGDATKEASTGQVVASRLDEALALLAAAAARLEADPTDMVADADVAEASATVFASEGHPRADAETWAALGRLTRRLMSALGADEALEDQIRAESAKLVRVLAPLVGGEAPDDKQAWEEAEKTVYDMGDWTPEERLALGVLLKEAGIAHRWDGDELLVPSPAEAEVEALFSQVVEEESPDASDESRYEALAELFAACGRLAADPADAERVEAVRYWMEQFKGPPLIGIDEVDWFHLVTAARNLEVLLAEEEPDRGRVGAEAATLRDLLRPLV